VTGETYTYLVNGHGPAENWTGIFRPGERVRLRIINAAAQSIFNVRIPGLAMTVVEADGQYVRPVTVEEFQIGNAETYDVIVTPTEDRAYTLVAEHRPLRMARQPWRPQSGWSRRPAAPQGPYPHHEGHGHGRHGSWRTWRGTRRRGHGPRHARQIQGRVPVGVGGDMISPMPVDRTGDPGLGLEDVGHKVLTYRDLVSADPNQDKRVPPAPSRSPYWQHGTLHVVLDGKKFSENPEPIRFDATTSACGSR
jgi:FtsP/CotA-like multicopper oxidase with cupredoxin domain